MHVVRPQDEEMSPESSDENEGFGVVVLDVQELSVLKHRNFFVPLISAELSAFSQQKAGRTETICHFERGMHVHKLRECERARKSDICRGELLS